MEKNISAVVLSLADFSRFIFLHDFLADIMQDKSHKSAFPLPFFIQFIGGARINNQFNYRHAVHGRIQAQSYLRQFSSYFLIRLAASDQMKQGIGIKKLLPLPIG